jgi:flagellar motor switch/type III secretory pathway protein FliN
MEKTVTLAELKLLTPGEIVELSKNNILDVEIRANQKKFARGELIQLPDGQLGVEIRTIWS